MKIFCLGFSRTGTKSLNAALRILGFNVLHYPCDEVTATEVIEGRPYSILEECDGLSDLHAAVRFRELDLLYPKSKFILTTREKHGWLDSCRRHFGRTQLKKFHGPRRKMMETLRQQAYKTSMFDAELFSEAYDRHVESVINYFRDRDQLLSLEIPAGDGWPQLCPFFDKPFSNRAFPRIR